ncbi:hypothetical protein RND81_14G157700 [Saponaria officinalis]|uniref:Uncharacterized protein n=1 Tax=Saponaria officinalis TaxID=3572 RepID=A0AAW1GQV7_SAPOF
MSVLPSVQPFHVIAYPLDLIVALEISRRSVVASRYALSPFGHPSPTPIKSGSHHRLRIGCSYKLNLVDI